jgi:hypothetical protein
VPADATATPVAPPPVDEKAAKGPTPTVFPPPQKRAPIPKRTKPLQTTIGMELGAVDFGAEADLISSVGRERPPADNRRWTYALRGFLRAPMRFSIGPETGSTDGSQLHSPPRMVGFNSDEWNYIGVAPAPTGQIQLNVSNLRVSGNIIIAGDVFTDAGYMHLDKMGGFSQAWVTLKSPALFGTKGGAALNVGAFSERFGAAGPHQQSTGYYGTYLFGRTHVAGESLVFDYDLSDDLELVVEHGFGAKVETVPFRKAAPPRAPYLPDQGPVPQGSNFLHHAHAALLVGDWMRVAAHYLTSWTPDDLGDPVTGGSKEGRLTVTGGEVHVDHPTAGNGYLGYSFVDAKRLLALSDAVQVIHGSTGMVFKENYFGPLSDAAYTSLSGSGDPATRDDSGQVHTLQFQYLLRARALLGETEPGVDASLAVFGMYNHVKATKHLETPGFQAFNFKQDRIKFGGELQVSPLDFLAVGLRFDEVMPDGGNADIAYSALSPRLVLHSKWISREYVILNYTRFFLGDQATPSLPYRQPRPIEPPYSQLTKADENLVSLTAMVAF